MSLQTRLTDLVAAIGADIKDLKSKVATPTTIAQEGWHRVGSAGEPAYQNLWTDYDARGLLFRKSPTGRVQLGGVIKSGNIGAVIFTLPLAYRPQATMAFPVMSNGALGQIIVGSDGNVIAQSGSNVYMDLSPVEFDTGQTTFPASIVTTLTSQENWHSVGAAGEPAFQNGFTNTGTRPLKFRKDPGGRVVIEGDIGSGAGVANDELLVFTLPVGYRPLEKVYQVVLISGAVAGGYIVINVDGTVLAHRGAVGNGMFITAEFWIPQGTFPASVATVTQEDWHTVGAAGEPAFQNNWVNFDATRTLRFKKYPDGRVRLSGMVKSGTVGSAAPIFTLPPGYRVINNPTGFQIPVQAGSAGAAVVGWLRILDTGAVSLVSGGNDWVFLDNVEFDTGQTAFPAGKSIIPVVSALPPGPTDGTEVYFQTTAMAVDGVMWHFRYRGKNPDGSNNTNTFKWEAVGEQQPLRVEGVGGRDYNTMEQTASLNFAALATAGPSIAAPLAGDYDVSGSAQAHQTASGGLASLLLWIPGYGNVTWNLGDASFFTNNVALTSGKIDAQRLITLTAGGTVELRYATSSVANPVKFYNRNLYLKPIRVG